MSLDMIEAICKDFLLTDFPLQKNNIILSGGDPLLHPNFEYVCDVVRKLNGSISLSTNGILIPKYISTFRKNDFISTCRFSIDGQESQ